MKKAKAWRWLWRLLWLSLLALLVLVGFSYWALPPLAERAVKQALAAVDLKSKAFEIESIGPRKTMLAEIAFAGDGWTFHAPVARASYGWEDVRSSRLHALQLPQATLTLDLEQWSRGESHQREGGKPSQEADGGGFTLPMDVMAIEDLTVHLKRGDAQRKLEGTATIKGATWLLQLKEGATSLQAEGTWSPSLTAEARGSVVQLPEWLAIGDLVLPIDLAPDDPVQVKASWTPEQWALHADAASLGVIDPVEASLTEGQLTMQGSKGGIETHFQSAVEELVWHDWEHAGGRFAWSLNEGNQEVSLTDGDLTHPSGFATPWEAKLSHSGDTGWQGTVQLKAPQFLDHRLEAIEATVGHREGKTAISAPRLLHQAWPMATLRALQGTIDQEAFHLTAEHVIDYGMGEVYGPVPVVCSGSLQEEGEWAWTIQAATQSGQRWQAYWKGLGFSIDGTLEAEGTFPLKTIALHSSWKEADVRRNESVVSWQEVAVSGTFDTLEGALSLDLGGQSQQQPFTGGLRIQPPGDGDERTIDYQLLKLKLPENTLLGAFSDPLKEMPMAAFLDAKGTVRIPAAGDPEHRLQLTLARGNYRHPERRLTGMGIGGTFAIESFDPFVTVDDQRATFSRFDVGALTLTDGQFRYKLGPDGAVLVREVQAKALDGAVTMEALSYHPGHPDFESVIVFHGIELERLAELYPNFQGRVGGRVDGQVHLRFKDSILSLPQGRLLLDPMAPAYLRLDAKEALGAQLSELADDPDALQIVEMALKDLVVHELEMGFFDPETNEAACQVRLRGRSREEVPIPNTQGGKAFAPIHLNISVEDPSELVRRLLNFGVRRQLETQLKESP